MREKQTNQTGSQSVTHAEQTKIKTIQKILSRSGNRTCADCSANDPTWASLKFGVWVCLNCSGYHRNIGAAHTRIQSAYLDQWSFESIQVFEALTNIISNKYWEANLDPELDRKPLPDHEIPQGLDFVKRKYVEKSFVVEGSKHPVENYTEFKQMAMEEDEKEEEKPDLTFGYYQANLLRRDTKSTTKTSIFDGMKIKAKPKGFDSMRSTPKVDEPLVDGHASLGRKKNLHTFSGSHATSLQEIPDDDDDPVTPIHQRAQCQTFDAERITSSSMRTTQRSSTKFYNSSLSRGLATQARKQSISPQPKKSFSLPDIAMAKTASTEKNISPTNIELAKAPEIPSRKESQAEIAVQIQTPKIRFLGFRNFYHRKQGQLIVLGGFLLHFVLGSFYMWGTISPYVTSYLKANDPSLSYDSLINTICFVQILSISLGLPFGVKIGRIVGFQKFLFFCSAIYCSSLFMSSQTNQLSWFVLFFAILPGISCGLIYMIPIYCAWECFPKKEGSVIGIINCAFALSTIVVSWLSNWIVDPDSTKILFNGTFEAALDPDVYNRAPMMLKYFSLIFIVVMFLGSSLICPKLSLKHLKVSLLDGEPNADTNDPDIKVRHIECPNIKSGLKSKAFRSLFILMMVTSIIGFYTLTNLQVFGENRYQTESFANFIRGAGTLANAFSRFFWARLLDKYSFKALCIAMLIIQGTLIATFGFVAEYNSLYMTWILGLLFCQGFIFPGFPVLVKRLFGMKCCTELYGILFMAYPIVNLLVYLINYIFLPSLDYQFMFILFLIPVLIGYTICRILNENPQWEQEEEVWVEMKDRVSSPAVRLIL